MAGLLVQALWQRSPLASLCRQVEMTEILNEGFDGLGRGDRFVVMGRLMTTSRCRWRTLIVVTSLLLFLGCSSDGQGKPRGRDGDYWRSDVLEVSLAALPPDAQLSAMAKVKRTHENAELGTKVQEFALDPAAQIHVRCVDPVLGTVDVDSRGGSRLEQESSSSTSTRSPH